MPQGPSASAPSLATVAGRELTFASRRIYDLYSVLGRRRSTEAMTSNPIHRHTDSNRSERLTQFRITALQTQTLTRGFFI